jgi:PadR family transcriptional regulator, regulatory protein AphA
MEYVVLGLLIIKGLTLYELNQAFKQGISLFYSASYGALQAAVKSLLGKGMIVFAEQVENGRNKKVYTITQPGRDAFFTWMFAEIPASKLEVTALSRVYFLGLIEGVEQKKQILQEILAKIQMVENDLHNMNLEISQYIVPDSFKDIFRYQVKTLDYGLHAHFMAREWFSALLKDLENPAQPEPDGKV